jgi:hypothetical protein
MVGGLLTSAFLTLEIIPVVYTYWRLWQLKHGGLSHPVAVEASEPFAKSP